MRPWTTLALCLLTVVAQAQDPFEGEPPSLYKWMFPAPTGRNGYEEYLQACDQLRNLNFVDAYKVFSERKLGEADFLKRYRSLVACAPRVRSLVLEGSRKPAFDPRQQISEDTLFYELRHLKNVVRFLCAQARVQFADGESTNGTQTLTAALKLSDSLKRSRVLIGNLVGVANQSIALAEFDACMTRMSIADLKSVEQTCDDLLQSPGLRMSLAGEAEYVLGRFQRIAQAPQLWGDFLDELDMEDVQELNRLKAATPDQIRTACDRAMTVSRVVHKRMSDLLDSDEAEWPAKAAELDQPVETEANPFVQVLLSQLGIHHQVLRTEFKQRIQLRLLKAHMAVQRFALERGQLPTDLTQLGDEALTRDPATGKPFKYIVTKKVYELYSHGGFDIGRIDLTYKASKSGIAVDDDVVRPPDSGVAARLSKL